MHSIVQTRSQARQQHFRDRAFATVQGEATLSDDDSGADVSFTRIPSPPEQHDVHCVRQMQDDEASTLLRHIRGFAPSRQIDVSESALMSPGRLQPLQAGGGSASIERDAESNESDTLRGGRHIAAPPTRARPPAPSVRVRQPKRVRRRDPRDPGLLALRAQRAPAGLPPARSLQQTLVGWRQVRVANEVALREEPWYQFAELVAGVAGVRISELIQFDPPTSRRQSLWPMAPPGGWPNVVYEPLPRRGAAQNGDAPEEASPGTTEDEEEQMRRPPDPTTPAREIVPPPRKGRRRSTSPVPPPFAMASRTGAPMSGASLQEGLEALHVDLQTLLDRPAGIDDAALQQLERRRRALRMLQNVQQTSLRDSRGDTDDASLVVFLNPNYVSQLRIGRDMLLARYPATLTNVTVEALESSEDAASFFSLLVGSLYSRGQFSGGRRPLRASDYTRYAEGATYAQIEFRYARFNAGEPDVRRQVTLDRRAMLTQQARNRNLAPWCTQSQQYAGHGFVGDGGEYSSEQPFGTSLKLALTSLPGFGPLADPAVAKASPYGFAGTGPKLSGL